MPTIPTLTSGADAIELDWSADEYDGDEEDSIENNISGASPVSDNNNKKKSILNNKNKIQPSVNTSHNVPAGGYLFYCIDKYTPHWLKKYDVDPNIYNNFWMTELVVESLPQLVINVCNAFWAEAWSEISIVSAVFSITIVVWSLCKIVYKIGFQGLDLKTTLL